MTQKGTAKKTQKKGTKSAKKAPKVPAGALFHVIGYGTFITRRTFERYKNVALCKVTGFRRIYPPRSNYPFALPAGEQDGFWALVFDIPPSKLPGLDAYEGVPALYERKTISVTLKSQEKISAEIYVASQSAIHDFKLADVTDPTDRWRKIITEKIPDLLKQFPELAEKVN